MKRGSTIPGFSDVDGMDSDAKRVFELMLDQRCGQDDRQPNGRKDCPVVQRISTTTPRQRRMRHRGTGWRGLAGHSDSLRCSFMMWLHGRLLNDAAGSFYESSKPDFSTVPHAFRVTSLALLRRVGEIVIDRCGHETIIVLIHTGTATTWGCRHCMP